MLEELKELLVQKKTYVLIIVGGIALLLFQAEIIEQKVFESIMQWLGLGGLFTLKAGLNRMEKKIENDS